MSKWSAIVGYHTDPATCGVARFNAGLAARLGVPVVPLDGKTAPPEPALWSVKWAELPEPARWRVRDLSGGHDILWHDGGNLSVTYAARRVYWAWDVGAPSLVSPRPATDRPDAAGVWLSLGMSHKVGKERSRYARAVTLARMEGWSPKLLVSSARHAGEPDDTGVTLRDGLGTLLPVVWLGNVSDEGLGLVWPAASLFVAFFDGGLQANHTSVHAALDAGLPVLTNWGERTPSDLKELTVNVDTLTEWPSSWPRGASPWTWERVLRGLGCE